MSRQHYWIGGSRDGRWAKFGERVVNGAGYYIIDTDDPTFAIRANDPAELMCKLGVQYRRYLPHLVQIDCEVLSQDKWPAEPDVWGDAHAD